MNNRKLKTLLDDEIVKISGGFKIEKNNNSSNLYVVFVNDCEKNLLDQYSWNYSEIRKFWFCNCDKDTVWTMMHNLMQAGVNIDNDLYCELELD